MDTTGIDTVKNEIIHMKTIPLPDVVRIQKQVINPEKRNKKLKHTKGRQKHRIRNASCCLDLQL
jgi:hypothetical protein